MGKRQKPTFKECLSLLRKRNAMLAESGFHLLRPRAKEHLRDLIEAFEAEHVRSVKCWLLELIGDARSEEALELLCEQALCSDESLQSWGIRGLELLDTKEARKFLFERGLRR